MRTVIRFLLLSFVLVAATACSSKFKTYHGPEVTRIIVFKAERRMHLLHNKKVLESFEIDLGFEPLGAKEFEGDGRTPEGRYRIDRRNPNSQFHLSIGINYPNTDDVALARKMGKKPGGEIFIHGEPVLIKDLDSPDWTAGCISVTNKEIEQIYAMVKDDTVIDIYP